MRALFIIALLITAVTLNAQTRRIAQRSHGGATTARYEKGTGSYGYFPMVTVHLESGKDTMVNEWDSLANPRYLQADTTPRAMFYPRDTTPKQNIREMGSITHKLIGKS